MSEQHQIAVLVLKQLLHQLKDSGLEIGIRFRLIGKMWQDAHMRVLHVTEKGVALNDEQSKKLIIIEDLSQVMQFELDKAFQQYQPHFHYSVEPALVKN